MRPHDLAIAAQPVDVRPPVRQEDPHGRAAGAERATAAVLLDIVDIFPCNGLVHGDGLRTLAVRIVKIQVGLSTHTIAEALPEIDSTAVGRLQIRIQVLRCRRPRHHKPELPPTQRRRQNECLGVS